MAELINNFPADLHTHTSLCKHAEGQPADYLSAAQQKSLSALATTDHCPNDHGYSPDIRMSMDDLDTYNQWLDEAQSQSNGTAFYRGIEADFYSGCIVELGAFLEEQDYDVVLGSVHYQSFWAEKDEERTLWDGDTERVWRRYFKLVGLMADSGLYDIVAHIDLPKRNGRRPSADSIEEMVKPTLDKIAAAGMSIEINTAGLNHEVNEMYPAPEILAWASERDISITFGSDAHKPEEVGQHFDKAIQLAQAAGYTEFAVYEKRQKRLIKL